ncbi:hypothetical protein CFC21_085751 [Triticum aestivum]|uniref:Neprosin PEP catalytic domain-containing protein n=2 Tax=Triticum aestivum TaxID=4565 RepID=A0A3B6PCV4_WHEAT|nr:hypothetical protein CFC21_085751 [Triticum aestivum]
MKGKQAISATLFMSFLVMVTRGKDVQYKRQEEDNTQILSYHRVNKTIVMQPNSFPVWMDIQTLPSDEPSTIECPTGTIPILHTNGSDTIAAHSYDGQLEYDVLYKKSCIDFSCPGFVQVSHRVGLGARIRSPSVYRGKQTVIHIQIFKDPVSKNWWLTYEHVAIGYWPSALFEFHRNKGDAAFWGGIVEGPTASSNSPQMGSGHFASEGYGGAAFVKNIQLANNEKGYFDTPNNSQVRPESSDKSKYTVERFEYSKYVGMRIFYGGLGSDKAY